MEFQTTTLGELCTNVFSIANTAEVVATGLQANLLQFNTSKVNGKTGYR